jgi:hypothetical protein
VCSADCKHGVKGFKLWVALITYITWAALLIFNLHWTVYFHSKNWFVSLLILGSRQASLGFGSLYCLGRFATLVVGLCSNLRSGF